MSTKRLIVTGVLGAGVACAAFSSTAGAIVVGGMPNADLAEAPFTLSFGDDDQASYTFTATGDNFGAGVSVSTIGSAEVASLGPPFNDSVAPTSYFEASPIDDALLALFVGYPEPAGIPFTLGGTFAGLRFTLDDGIHFGYAEVATGFSAEDATFVGFGYETDAGEGILTGASPAAAAVPEPTTLSLLALGLVGLGFGACRRRYPANRDVPALCG